MIPSSKLLYNGYFPKKYLQHHKPSYFIINPSYGSELQINLANLANYHLVMTNIAMEKHHF